MKKKSIKLGRSAAYAAVIGVFLGGGLATPAMATEGSQSAPNALSEFERSLEVRSENGEVEAQLDQTRLQGLDEAELTELGEILAGESDISPFEPSEDALELTTDESIILKEGEAEWGIESFESSEYDVTGSTSGGGVKATAASFVSPRAPEFTRVATVGKSVWGTQWFKFAGIKLTETKVWGNYSVKNGKITKITDYGCQVVKNIVPGKHVTTSKQSKSLTSSTATFKCKVRVERGAIKGMNWSTREGYQTLKANAKGKVTSNGWT